MTRTPAHPPRRRTTRRARARGFALPLVMMLSFVVVVLVAAMLTRQGAQGASVARQTEAVRDWHFSRGVREIVDQWLKNKAANSVRDTLAVDGRAFDLVFDDQTRMSLYLQDVQGTLLNETTGLSSEETLDVVGSLDALRQSVAASRFTALTRKVGPPDVSLWTAPDEVIAAICTQIAGDDSAGELTREILELRATKDKVTASDLNEAAVKVNLPDGKRRALTRMIASEPSLFRFVLDVKAPSSATPVARYTGFLVARSAVQRTSGASRTPAQPPRTAFLSWEKVPPR